MKIKAAYYPRQLPNQIMVVSLGGMHYLTNLAPYRKITMADLKPAPGYDVQRPEQYWDKFDAVPAHSLKFYGLELSEDHDDNQ